MQDNTFTNLNRPRDLSVCLPCIFMFSVDSLTLLTSIPASLSPSDSSPCDWLCWCDSVLLKYIDIFWGIYCLSFLLSLSHLSFSLSLGCLPVLLTPYLVFGLLVSLLWFGCNSSFLGLNTNTITFRDVFFFCCCFLANHKICQYFCAVTSTSVQLLNNSDVSFLFFFILWLCL